jgi:hypothetical protein
LEVLKNNNGYDKMIGVEAHIKSTCLGPTEIGQWIWENDAPRFDCNGFSVLYELLMRLT